MSVRTMARVWELSRHSGTELLMLLAIADFADDDGNAYPAVGTLATKCRMKPRNANYILRALQESGELRLSVGGGPRGTNRYRITLAPLQPAAPLQCSAPLQPIAAPPAIQRRLALQPIADKPSVNHQEPPTGATTDVDGLFIPFWNAYPRKVGKDAARKAFVKRKPSRDLLAAMLAALSQQATAPAWAKDGGRYIPHPATWLNDGRWQDEVAGQDEADDRPEWALRAGFANRFEAENEGCYAHNAAAFNEGKQLKEPR